MSRPRHNNWNEARGGRVGGERAQKSKSPAGRGIEENYRCVERTISMMLGPFRVMASRY